jgi:predicted kinase
MARKLILVAGYAGSGKTRIGRDLARRLPACYLDKDTIATPFVERLLESLHQPAGDRDSPVYQQEIRPLEYEALMAAGLEAASLGCDVVLSAPFLAQLTDAAWTARASHQADDCAVQITVVWVACNLLTLRQRMKERNSPRDSAKLAIWRTYASAVDERLDEKFCVTARRFNNSAGSDYESELIATLTALSLE